MNRRTHLLIGLAVIAAVTLGGCAELQDWFKTSRTRLLDPSSPFDAPENRSPINPILPSVGYADRPDELPPNATFPREGDLTYTDKDYVVGPTDVLDISILDLFAEGLETTLRREVEASGFIDLPLLGQRIRAEGQTKEELKQAIADAYSPEILLNPVVSVTLLTRRQSTFAILGSIQRPGTYNIVRKDMRLLEALALSGGVTRANLRYVFVIRPAPATRVAAADGETDTTTDVEAPVEPPTIPELPDAGGEDASESPGDDVERALDELREAMPGAGEGDEQPAPAVLPHFAETADVPATGVTADAGHGASDRSTKWIYTDGRWVRVEQDAAPATRPSGEGAPPVLPRAKGEPLVSTEPPESPAPAADPFGWERVARTDLARVIAVNLPKLRDGDPRMNIVVRDNDIIQVPTIKVGEFYVMGEVARPGVYSLTGREITVKQAVAAAGNLGPLAWPENSVLIRRVGNSQEQIIPLDVEAIFRGEEPDMYLKPDDVIAVGTDIRAPFFAVMRNAFRMSYGFGFIYDRNFASAVPRGLDSERFRRW